MAQQPMIFKGESTDYASCFTSAADC